MAKIQIKSEKIVPFGGILPIMKAFLWEGEYTYRCILTNDYDSTDREIVVRADKSGWGRYSNANKTLPCVGEGAVRFSERGWGCRWPVLGYPNLFLYNFEKYFGVLKPVRAASSEMVMSGCASWMRWASSRRMLLIYSMTVMPVIDRSLL